MDPMLQANDYVAIGGMFLAAVSIVLTVLLLIFKAINQRFDDLERRVDQRFDDTQKTMDQRFDDTQKTMDQRFDDAQKANDLAHARIGDNIRNLERRVDSLERHVDSGLANVHTQLAAMTPRAMAAPPAAADTQNAPVAQRAPGNARADATE